MIQPLMKITGEPPKYSQYSFEHVINLNLQIYLYGYTNVSENYPFFKEAGGRLNKKDGLTRYGDSHVKDKTS